MDRVTQIKITLRHKFIKVDSEYDFGELMDLYHQFGFEPLEYSDWEYHGVNTYCSVNTIFNDVRCGNINSLSKYQRESVINYKDI